MTKQTAFYITSKDQFVNVQKLLLSKGNRWTGSAANELWEPSSYSVPSGFCNIGVKDGIMFNISDGNDSYATFLARIDGVYTENVIEETIVYTIKEVETLLIDGKHYRKSDIDAA